MRGKGERHIPDFSRKPKPAEHGAGAPDRTSAPTKPHVPAPQPKPHGTSAKSGRRGQ